MRSLEEKVASAGEEKRTSQRDVERERRESFGRQLILILLLLFLPKKVREGRLSLLWFHMPVALRIESKRRGERGREGRGLCSSLSAAAQKKVPSFLPSLCCTLRKERSRERKRVIEDGWLRASSSSFHPHDGEIELRFGTVG